MLAAFVQVTGHMGLLMHHIICDELAVTTAESEGMNTEQCRGAHHEP